MARKHAASSYISSSVGVNKDAAICPSSSACGHALLLSNSCSALLVARPPALLVSTKPALHLGFSLVVKTRIVLLPSRIKRWGLHHIACGHSLLGKRLAAARVLCSLVAREGALLIRCYSYCLAAARACPRYC